VARRPVVAARPTEDSDVAPPASLARTRARRLGS